MIAFNPLLSGKRLDRLEEIRDRLPWATLETVLDAWIPESSAVRSYGLLPLLKTHLLMTMLDLRYDEIISVSYQEPMRLLYGDAAIPPKHIVNAFAKAIAREAFEAQLMESINAYLEAPQTQASEKTR